MNLEIPVTKCSKSRIGLVDYENLGFGPILSDHMFCMEYSDGAWRNPEIVPYGPIPVEPGVASLHYGQTVFDGLKAFWGDDGVARVFRPDRNIARLDNSCDALCIPRVEHEYFMEAVRLLVDLDRDWIPRKPGHSLYIRPLVIGMEEHLEVRAANRYRFFIMTAPVGNYFSNTDSGVSLRVEHEHTRAAPGGLGYAKTAANYAAALYPTTKSRAAGADQVLWLDGAQHRYVEEVGAMNIFFKIDGQVVTPPLGGTILPGITRESVITLLADRGITVQERRIAIDEVVQAFHDGKIEEVFGAGTAAVISPVRAMTYKGETLQVPGAVPGVVTTELYQQITGIQCGRLEDRHGWNMLVPISGQQTAAIPSVG